MTPQIMTLPARPGCGALAAMLLPFTTVPAVANDFALSVSPPRFELSTAPGETVRAVVEIANASAMGADLAFATAEWELTKDGGVTIDKAIKPGSCRPWVAIERRQTRLQGKSQLRYRFEVTPPVGTLPTECRFAITISGGDAMVSPSKDTNFPVSAQIALIVYVKVGDVKPQIRITKADVVKVNGIDTPVLLVENTGTAHGRLTAFLTGIDAKGKKREFAASSLPILPGETRSIALNIDDGTDAITAPPPSDAKPDVIAYPLKVKGTISDSVSSFSFDGVFETE